MKAKNWQERIEVAKRQRLFTYEDREAAGSWVSCAVSENPKIKMRKPSGIVSISGPYNPRASELGLAFNMAVRRDSYLQAEKLLKQIMRLRT